ncbi:MAG: Acid phosphatase [Chlamydiales bacterium]|nr:Acid phosphatase [Chlamydiales bacterium]MCH9635281.1 Acid phosphatase [Chlamydiales bacterium]MCH9704253.1 histidine phosphatase family protein [Chlamydiota bacterium]
MAPKSVTLCRHGETKWSKSGKHTSSTDLDLTVDGREEAELLGDSLGSNFDAVFCSPLKRAVQTAELAGFSNFEIEDALFEWRYGDYEGVSSEQIHRKEPKWNLFEDGAPGGESVAEVESRAAEFVKRLQQLEGDILLFSSGHISRVLGAVWIRAGAHFGKFLKLSTASKSILAYEHGYPVITSWNDTSHLKKR